MIGLENFMFKIGMDCDIVWSYTAYTSFQRSNMGQTSKFFCLVTIIMYEPFFIFYLCL
ncbi:hypothetical protein Hanom_Chr00s000004g01606611 [Helianthus anomalus]